MHTDIYAANTPVLIDQLADTPELQRLSDIGMHCGCEYARIPIYKQSSRPYSRLIHSIGVSKIIWHFTNDIRQAIAGLLHDIATPVFAHTIDFLNNDHISQESTEAKTISFIVNSVSILSLLEKNHICIEDICDYHKYPIADNDTPMLSSDRLEYTLGNAYTLFNTGLGHLREIYENLSITENEKGVPELCFNSMKTAKAFLEISLRNSYLYVSDSDRFLMQYLSDIICRSLKDGVLSQIDLYTTETSVIHKLTCNSESSEAWNKYINLNSVSVSNAELKDRYCIKVFAKRRYIDPLVLTEIGASRLSELDFDAKNMIGAFLNLDFDKWLYA